MECELKKSSSKKGHGGCYAKLKPVQDASGIWVVGERLTRYNAMTPDSSLQRLLPSKHPATRLFMPYFSKWGLKSGLQKENPLPGEKMCSTAVARVDPPLIVYERFENINRVIWVMATLKNIARNKSFSAGNAMQVTKDKDKDKEDFVVKNIQETMECELKKSSSKKGHGGRYAKLKPVQDASGIWVVGEQLTRYNAMTPDSSLQRLLPSKHPATRLFMPCFSKFNCRRKLARLP